MVLFFVIMQEGPSQSPVQTPQPHHVRTKRCSCNSWQDKECIYFCHLDIIWVNTPSKVLPYGLGSLLSRHRRSASRCECAEGQADAGCSSFCHNRSIVSFNAAIAQKSWPATKKQAKSKTQKSKIGS
ncbi:unnamed protein product [Merluccius merluccius]